MHGGPAMTQNAEEEFFTGDGVAFQRPAPASNAAPAPAFSVANPSQGLPAGFQQGLPPQTREGQQGSNIQAGVAATTSSGSSVSQEVARSRIVVSDAAQRVPVNRDDPDSAWWEVNPSFAFARSQLLQRPLLLLFTGEWNSRAVALSDEVFASNSFSELAKDRLVVCYLKYPRNVTEASRANRRLKEKFKVRGYPNVLLFHPNGELVSGIRGYRTGRPVDYFHRLKGEISSIEQQIQASRQELENKGFRMWTHYLGQEVFCQFERRDDTLVTLLDVEGVEYTVRINDLAPQCQIYAESFPIVKYLPETSE